ncbi:MAG: hypothetical protein COW00_16180 [Bdellovibrio sp. CG12_big_fil_rev_8_21_14_0_65_39_13]|nr:MAG: hypothetical protein COW78_02560 [Bdellovibrio sp. CG22_combo_CG10-13_8_21_14_all_39_27]PIQ58380.1 MAG: hypothetical protein COW00_16180 [Bdellovibrio sp. CG12_big_fil_rev_8_21_14_0_65_39_13]PIR35893.1 MAG: hypothetical protein COV37_06765 [Bdellovibrio sp. CG11_big_fil_rev_8_21_14_0_20_39_38]PJB53689.1 MAG: hypothetical protein CO099_05780 [Bdellovibrio sp. CG_4_9_14_3_um_filter_39_7]
MKVVIVSSQLTYVPDNYRSFYRTLLEHDSDHDVVGLILLKNVNFQILKSLLGLSLIGAKMITKHLVQNLLSIPKAQNEKLFLKNGRWVKSFESMNDPEAIQFIKDQQIDLVINARTRCIYKNEILKAPKWGCLNIHHGLLPEYRGTLCDLYALTEQRDAGFSIHHMTSKIDAGVVYKRVSVSRDMKDYPLYLDMAAKKEGEVLSQLIAEIKKHGQLPEGQSNHCAKPLYTKNPTRSQIKKFLNQGFIL